MYVFTIFIRLLVKPGLLLVLLLSGCGQMGPLYLPVKDSQIDQQDQQINQDNALQTSEAQHDALEPRSQKLDPADDQQAVEKK